MSDTPQDPLLLCKYTEGCHALRHYSLGVLRVRTITIVQGLALLAAAGYFVREHERFYAMAIALFGLAFTAVLNRLQSNYWRHFEAVLSYITTLEALHPGGVSPGPWSAYGGQREDRFSRRSWRVLTIHGPYLLLLAALVAVLFFAVFSSIGSAIH